MKTEYENWLKGQDEEALLITWVRKEFQGDDDLFERYQQFLYDKFTED